MLTIDSFQTTTLRSLPEGENIRKILLAALQAVEPGAAVARNLVREGNLLHSGDFNYDLSLFKRIFIIGAGKAGAPMLRAGVRILGDCFDDSLVIVKDGSLGWPRGETIPLKVRLVEAGHPLPDPRGLQATRQMLDLLAQTTSEDLVICLISGGGSALLTAPAEGVSLGDMQDLTTRLLRCGASINEINTLRKHLDTVKGGGLARAAAPAQLLTLVLSDVVGSPLDVIASGPTVADRSTYADCQAILKRYGLEEDLPDGILKHLRDGAAGRIADTPKPGDPIFERTHTLVIASNQQAAQAAVHEAESLGFNSLLLTTFLQGEARQAGRTLAAIARQMNTSGQPVSRPACLVTGGETTVSLRGDGLGGRNTELALAAVPGLAGLEKCLLVSLATDGGDGPTDSAGAVVSGETLERAARLKLSPEDFLARNDSYHYFEKLGDLIKTGPTQTNVNDLVFVFAL